METFQQHAHRKPRTGLLLTPERAWKFAHAGSATMVFQTNTATNKEDRNNDTGQAFRFDNSAAHQAAWVKFCQSQGIEVAFWEIGNEPEMDAPQEHKQSQEAVYAWYNRVFREQAEALKKADPRVRIMGPAATNTWFWWAQHNLEKLMKAHGNREGTGLVDAVSLHWYPDRGSGSWEQKRAAAQEWAGCMKYIREVLAKCDSRDLPVYLTEWNWGAGDKNDSGAKLANALGNADCVGMFLRTGVAGHTHFCLQRIQRGWGVLAGGDGNSRPNDEPSPIEWQQADYARCSLAARGTAETAVAWALARTWRGEETCPVPDEIDRDEVARTQERLLAHGSGPAVWQVGRAGSELALARGSGAWSTGRRGSYVAERS